MALSRSTPLRRTPLARGKSELMRTPMPRSSKPMRQVGKKSRRDRTEMDAATPELAERSGGRCELVVAGIRCPERAVHRHHVVRRSHGGSNGAENLVHLCLRDHDRVHANVAWSKAHGYLS